jgi:hypothetical protein
MSVYLYFLERYQNYLPLLYCSFLLVLHQIVSRVLQDRRQSKSESVFKVIPVVHCVPTIITSSLFIRFEYMSNDWKVSYEFGIGSFLRLQSIWDEKFRFSGIPDSVQNRISAA